MATPPKQVWGPVAITAAVVLAGGAAWHHVATTSHKSASNIALPGLPTEAEARDMLKKAGADVKGERVHFDPAMIEELIKLFFGDFPVNYQMPAA